MLGSLILYLKGMRTTMFQLSGFYCNSFCSLGRRWKRRVQDLHRDSGFFGCSN